MTIAQDLGLPVILKAQVQTSGRELAGGFLIANMLNEVQSHADHLFESTIDDLPVNYVLVEQLVNVEEEIYIAIVNDRNRRKPILVASREGGTNVHAIAQTNPEVVYQEIIEPLIGLRDYQIRRLTSNLYLEPEHWPRFYEIISGLYRCFMETDATLAEINPLALSNNRLLALDAKLYIDDNALYRQSQLAAQRDTKSEPLPEIQAREADVVYHKLVGQIGCMVNGAGLAMTVMDMIVAQQCDGIGPANFLDIGGGAEASKIHKALRIIVSDRDVDVVLISVFGGITRCDEVARAIVRVWQELRPHLPLVVRLSGTRAEDAHQLLLESQLTGLMMATTLKDAVDKAVAAVRAPELE
jgi:succinyl-CoA synthetase beta subunit